MERYIRPEDEIKTPEGEISKEDPQRTGFIPTDQIPDPDREKEFYEQIESGLKNNELLELLIDGSTSDPNTDNTSSTDDPMEFYRQRYPDLFPSEENITIQEDEALKTSYDNKASKIKSSKTREVIEKQKKFHKKGTPKKDRRHGKESNKREVLKFANKRERKITKQALRRLAA